MDTFAALAVSTRRDIVEMLAHKGRLSATDISKQFDVTPSAISQHLKVLREAKLLTMEKEAQYRMYEINPDAIRALAEWTAQMSRRFGRLDTVLEAEKQKSLKVLKNRSK